MEASISTITLAIVTGLLAVIIPKISHRATPAVNAEYIKIEIPLVSFVLRVLIT
jgi:hypothetical protein